MIKEINSRFDDYLISSKIRKKLLHQGFELVENDLLEFFLVHIKMSYYWFNKQELLQRAKDRHCNVGGKEKAAERYIVKKRCYEKKERNNYRNFSGK